MADAPAPLHFFHSKSAQTKSQQRGGAGRGNTLSHTHTHPHTHTQCICILLRGLSSIFNPLQTHLHALNSALGGRLSGRVRVGGVAALSSLASRWVVLCCRVQLPFCILKFKFSYVKREKWLEMGSTARSRPPLHPPTLPLHPFLADKIFA